MKKNIEIFLKIIMTISILIGICIFIISRTLGNTGKIGDLMKYYGWWSTALVIFVALFRTIFKPE